MSVNATYWRIPDAALARLIADPARGEEVLGRFDLDKEFTLRNPTGLSLGLFKDWDWICDLVYRDGFPVDLVDGEVGMGEPRMGLGSLGVVRSDGVRRAAELLACLPVPDRLAPWQWGRELFGTFVAFVRAAAEDGEGLIIFFS